MISENLTIVVCSKSNLFELKRTLDSLRKTNFDIPEVILILSEYENSEIDELKSVYKPIISEIHLIPSSSIYEAMNIGISKANKKYLMFLNAGDTLINYSNLEKLLYSSNKKLWGYGQIIQINPGSRSKLIRFNPYIGCLHKNSFKYVPHPATIVDTNTIKELGGFDIEFKVAADQKLLIQLANMQKPGLCKLPIVNFYVGGASSRTSREIVKDYTKINRDLYGPKMKSMLIDRIYWNIILFVRNSLNFLKHSR